MTLHETIIASAMILILVLFIYHHFGFPIISRFWAARVPAQMPPSGTRGDGDDPLITVFMPAYNEADHIADKLLNLACVDYPKNKIQIIVACDGCRDNTAALARATAQLPELQEIYVQVIEETENKGKIAILNQYLPKIDDGIIALSDVSAHISPNAFKRAAQHFQNADVGVVAATYQLSKIQNQGEAAYWKYQVANKLGEAALGAPLGVHGALYFVRAGAYQTLESDTINDDFILPMRIVAAGSKAVYDVKIIATEREVADGAQDFSRRLRISAGNVQQILRVPQLMSPKMGGVAFAFMSGKALRAVMPFLLALFVTGSLVLSVTLDPARAIVGLEALILLIAGGRHFFIPSGTSKVLDIIHYLILGHTAGLIGGCRYLFGPKQGPWSRSTHAKETLKMVNQNFESQSIAIVKRAIDIVGSLVGLILTSPFLILICLAIKLDSKGPIVFKQMRVGRARPHMTELFTMYKFRSMRVDAESKSGPVWATKNDPRITRVGRFMRKTRLDEIPQLVNVLKGEMSLVGPRPERPGICDKLENAIPYYADRTYGVRPGITGLAQVFQGYDETIEDVRSKVSYDHAYALASGTWKTWLLLDLEILARTVTVVLFGRGQ